MIRRQKSSRQVGVCGSALERAPVPRKTSRIRRSRSRRLKRPLAPARRSAAVCGGLGSRAKKEPKKAYRDFQAIRRKGVVQGQSRQALMSWRIPYSITHHLCDATRDAQAHSERQRARERIKVPSKSGRRERSSNGVAQRSHDRCRRWRTRRARTRRARAPPSG